MNIVAERVMYVYNYQKLYEKIMLYIWYEVILKTVVLCNECRILFSFGKSDTEFAEVYEFSDYGGEKIRFYDYLYRDSEGTFNHFEFLMS